VSAAVFKTVNYSKLGNLPGGKKPK